MAKSKIEDIKTQDVKALIGLKAKKQAEIVAEKSALAQAGKKNSNKTKILRKEIARIETVIQEKLFASV
jgi:ribosomal protein L29